MIQNLRKRNVAKNGKSLELIPGFLIQIIEVRPHREGDKGVKGDRSDKGSKIDDFFQIGRAHIENLSNNRRGSAGIPNMGDRNG